MKASFVDLRKKSGEILRALERNESVTVLYRGRPKAIMQPLPASLQGTKLKSGEHPACGMWADRADMKDPAAYVRRIRQGRVHGI
jgi:hypothetical protein